MSRIKWLLGLLPVVLISIQLFGLPVQAGMSLPPPDKTKHPTETPFPTFTSTVTPIPQPATPTPAASPSPTAGPLPSLTPTPLPTTTVNLYTIPSSRGNVRVDGNCGSFEYSDALRETYVDGNNTNGVVYLKHNDQYLFVCMIAPQGSYASRFAAVYLDPDGRGEPFPSADELSLRIGITDGSMTTLRGGGTPGVYYPASVQGWTAAVQTGSSFFASISPYDVAEFRIPLFYTTQCGNTANMSVYHHWFSGPSNDYGWPQSQYWDQPSTWANVQMAGISSLFTCSYLPMVRR